MPDYDAGVWHGVRARASGPGRPTATGPRARTTRPGACAATRPSCCSTRTPGPSAATVAVQPGRARLRLRGDPDTPERRRLRRRRAPQPGGGPAAYGWRDAGPLRRPYADTVIYEVHVKGFTMRHPDVPPELRGTYAGLAHEAAHRLPARPRRHRGRAAAGAPVRARGFLVDRGPDQLLGLQHRSASSPRTPATRPRSAPGGPAARSPSSRPWSTRCTRPGSRSSWTWCSTTPPRATSSARRCASAAWTTPAYYRLDDGDPRHYFDTTGTGNSLNAGHPRTPAADHGLAALLADRDARRRLPLRPGRHPGPPGAAASTSTSAFFDLVSQDPVVSRAKLIAEPWDVGQTDSYDLGRFPPLWSEWNGRYRDSMRDFWRSHDGRARRVRHPVRGLVRPVRRVAGGGRPRRST